MISLSRTFIFAVVAFYQVSGQSAGSVAPGSTPYGLDITGSDIVSEYVETTVQPATTADDATCSFNPCFNGGICVKKSGTYTCVCPYPSTGVVCQNIMTTTPPPPTTVKCSFNPCFNGGVCENPGGGTYMCHCPPSHTGVVCQTEITTTAEPVTTTVTTTVAPVTTTVAPVTPTVAPVTTTKIPCPDSNINKNNLGCRETEVVFLLEYADIDSEDDIDHEGDFIKEMIGEWKLGHHHIQVGVVVYHDTVTEAIHIGDYDDEKDLEDAIDHLTKHLNPSGEADLALAMDYAREHAFNGARSDAHRVVIPIIHQMSKDGLALEKIPAAADRLKDECYTIIGYGVDSPTFNLGVANQLVTQPPNSHLVTSGSFDALENAGDNFDLHC